MFSLIICCCQAVSSGSESNSSAMVRLSRTINEPPSRSPIQRLSFFSWCLSSKIRNAARKNQVMIVIGMQDRCYDYGQLNIRSQYECGHKNRRVNLFRYLSLHKHILAIVSASWTMFNHEGFISTKSIVLFKSRDGEWTAILKDSLHTGVIP